MRAGIAWVDTDDIESAPDFDSDATQLNSLNSRWGIKGSEDLDGGLSAIYQMEFGVTIDREDTGDGGDFLYMRNSFVGLKGGFGSVRLGVMDSPYRKVSEWGDPFKDSFADNNTILGRLGGNSFFNDRFNNVIQYNTPNFSGFKGMFAYSVDQDSKDDNLLFGDENFDPNADHAYSIALKYKQAPFKIAVGTESKWFNEGEYQISGYKGNASFMFGDKEEDENWGKIGGIVESLDLEEISPTDFDYSHLNFLGYGKYAFGKWMAKGTFGIAGEIKEAPDNYDTGETSAQFWGAGVEHRLSKRTRLWLEYAGVSNGEAADYGLGQVEDNCNHYIPNQGGASSSAFSLGIRHDF